MAENPRGLLIDPPLEPRPFVAGGRITAMPAKRTRRRLLIDEQFMSRTAAGVYWRAGGTVS
jgi:hypothetical protein